MGLDSWTLVQHTLRRVQIRPMDLIVRVSVQASAARANTGDVNLTVPHARDAMQLSNPSMSEDV